ncbi:hypothetical protein [Spirillospora sp. CA-294931]|uniref:hypothetical protein n=1 Tax=Spirillospora sp. CA-294931 TaxID=3240042 RepID=UPI003D908C1F
MSRPDDAAAAAEPERPPAPEIAVLAPAFQLVGQVVAQTTALVAVLYYFGWARSNALLGHLGIDPALTRWSATDYALRSVSVVVRPLVIVAILVLCLRLAHRLLTREVERRDAAGGTRAASVVGLTLVIAGLVLTVAGLLGFADVVVFSARYPLVPMILGAGVGLIAYGLQYLGPGEARISGISMAVLIALAVTLILWTVSVYAGLAGRDAARLAILGLGNRTSVTVYSEDDLGFAAPGTGLRAERLAAPEGRYKYRYTGLRLLLYSDKRYILLPDRWVRTRDPVFVIDEADGLRFELRHPSRTT